MLDFYVFPSFFGASKRSERIFWHLYLISSVYFFEAGAKKAVEIVGERLLSGMFFLLLSSAKNKFNFHWNNIMLCFARKSKANKNARVFAWLCFFSGLSRKPSIRNVRWKGTAHRMPGRDRRQWNKQPHWRKFASSFSLNFFSTTNLKSIPFFIWL